MADAEATYTAQHAPGEGQRVVVARRAALGPGVDVPAAARNSDDGLVCGPVVIRIAVDGTVASVTLPRPPSGDGSPAAEGTPSVESIAQTLTASGDTVTVCDVLLPGFVDIHTHGRGGAFDMSEFWLNPDFTTSRLPAMATTSLLASMVFCCGQVDGLSSTAMQTYAHLSGKVGKTGAGAVIEGVHAEGPVVADLGGLPESGCQRMDLERFAKLLDAMSGCELKVMTIAPSIDAKDGYARIRMLLERGVLPALGHDRYCTETDILGALVVAKEFGVRLHVTHLFNVCGFHHRNPSLCNFGLIPRFPALPEYAGLIPPTVEVIGDMAHVHPMTVQAVLAARDPDDVAVITDSVMEPVPNLRKEYGGRTLVVTPNASHVYLEGTDTLAGSCCSMLDAFHSLTKTLGVSIGDAAKIVSTTPARIANLPNVGAVEPGRRADFVLFKSNSVGDPATSTDPAECADPTTVTHVATMIAGDTVFDAANP